MLNVNAITSRNQNPKYTYFLVVSSSENIQSLLPLLEFNIYVFTNPVTADRGNSILTNTFSQQIIPIEDTAFPTGSFPHPRYTNQNSQPLQLFYKDLSQIVVPIEASRTENINVSLPPVSNTAVRIISKTTLNTNGPVGTGNLS